jgi:hypothetical protein
MDFDLSSSSLPSSRSRWSNVPPRAQLRGAQSAFQVRAAVRSCGVLSCSLRVEEQVSCPRAHATERETPLPPGRRE